MINNIFKIIFLFFLTGCASITESKNQSMSVTTGDITGAMCTLSNSKGSYFVNLTPGTVSVRNACDPLAITCTKKGYVPSNPAAGTVQDKAKSMAWGNIVFGGIIGIAVDRSTGAGCQYPQQNVFYPMQKASADSGKTDIEELKNLKELLDTGVITQDEFDKAKKKVLN